MNPCENMVHNKQGNICITTFHVGITSYSQTALSIYVLVGFCAIWLTWDLYLFYLSFVFKGSETTGISFLYDTLTIKERI